MQQLAPYVGKLKSGMARVLIEQFSNKGDTVLDPFCGSGVVPYESLLAGRHAIGNDLNPYAFVVTKGKLTAPRSHAEAERKATSAIKRAAEINVDLTRIPEWVKVFFHPRYAARDGGSDASTEGTRRLFLDGLSPRDLASRTARFPFISR